MNPPKISRYKIVEEIGRGGMATVYKAMQDSLSREVALKVLPVYFAHDQEFVERFRREALAVAKLRHPNIVSVFSFQREDDVFYIVMEYIDGGSLQEHIRKQEKLGCRESLEIACQVADALHHAHSRGFVHRDIKPSNILMTKEGQAVLTDFGIVKALEGTSFTRTTDSGIGTSEYMSPEQAQGHAVDSRCDVYGLGTVLYEMLTGRTPFRADTPAAVIHQQIYEAVEYPRDIDQEIPVEVEEIVLRCLRKNPEERFVSAKELHSALRKALEKERVEDSPATGGRTSVTGIRRELRSLEKFHEPREAGAVIDWSGVLAFLGQARGLARSAYWIAAAIALVLILVGGAPYLASARSSSKSILPVQKLGNLILVQRQLSPQVTDGSSSLVARVTLMNKDDRPVSFTFRERIPAMFAASGDNLLVSVRRFKKSSRGKVLDFPVSIGPGKTVTIILKAPSPDGGSKLATVAAAYERGFAELESVRLKGGEVVVKQGSDIAPSAVGVLSDESTVPVDLAWRSENDRVAKVGGGRVRGVLAGKTRLIGTLGRLSTVAKCAVLPIPVSLIIAAETTQTVVGGSVPLDVSVKLSDGSRKKVKATWRSADAAVGKVENDIFQGSAVGSTTVTATYGKFTAKLALLVAEPPEEQAAPEPIKPTSSRRSGGIGPKPVSVTARPGCSCGGLLCSCSSSGHGAACGGTTEGRCRHAPAPRWCPAPHPSIPGAPGDCPNTPGDLHLHQ